MTSDEYKLHELMVRHANAILTAHQDMMRQATGMLALYRTWLGKQVVENPDPVDHFKHVDDRMKQTGGVK